MRFGQSVTGSFQFACGSQQKNLSRDSWDISTVRSAFQLRDEVKLVSVAQAQPDAEKSHEQKWI